MKIGHEDVELSFLQIWYSMVAGYSAIENL